MSAFYTIDRAVLTEYGLNPYELTLYNVLASHINRKSGLAWPSYPRLMEQGHMARATVSKYLQSLESKGLIQIIRTYRPGTRARAVNQYRLLHPYREGSSRAEFEVVHAANEGSSRDEPEVVHAVNEGSSRAEFEVVHAANGNYTEAEQNEKTTKNRNNKREKPARKSSARKGGRRHKVSPPENHRMTEAEEKLWNEFCSQLADTCQLDFTINEKEIRRAARILWRSGSGYTVENLKTFGQWWYAHDWRGKKGDVPRLKEVLNEIRKAVESQQSQDRYAYIGGNDADIINY